MLSQGPPCARTVGKEGNLKTGVERNQGGENDKTEEANTLCFAQSDKKLSLMSSYTLPVPKRTLPQRLYSVCLNLKWKQPWKCICISRAETKYFSCIGEKGQRWAVKAGGRELHAPWTGSRTPPQSLLLVGPAAPWAQESGDGGWGGLLEPPGQLLHLHSQSHSVACRPFVSHNSETQHLRLSKTMNCWL